MKANLFRRRRAPVIATVVAMLVLVPALLLAAQKPSAAGSTVLTIFTGTAQVARRTADFAAANDGDVLAAGDRVRTDDSGHALVTFFDGSTLELEPSTTVRIDTAETNANGSIAIQMTQTLGRTWASVQKLTRPDSRFEIRTPSSTAAVRGTAFLTEVQSNGDTVVETTEGTVAVSAQGQTVLVTAGQTTNVQNSQPPSAPTSVPAPSNTIRFGMHSPAHLIVVDPLGRACGYAMPGPTLVRQIPGCAVSALGSEPETIDVPNAPGGTYRTTITAIDPGGAFTLTATGLDRAGTVAFDLSLAGDGKPGQVFGSSLDVRASADGGLSASGLSALVVLQGPTPSPSPSRSPSPSPVTTTSAPTPSFVPSVALPTIPIATPTPTPSPSPTPSPTPTPTASPSPTPTASPTPTPTIAPPPPAPSPAPSPTQCITPSNGNGNCDQHKP